ncbi:phosphate ABC transporter permease [Streptomyces abyssalis]|uniref:Phosphate transport system permease protein PstA n=1 Tax=Streptomyces abyssalis TaxID=933944 RepID=A0A1E7JP20_9ACTN|nr:phosphate ABC transporter permease PstA [Streptomyces abyssalis]OEU86618.1 phosphate ABC transporter permease [Streptomyces abyssalis]OEU89994.1 phosphate ABC transporter permease [Streptomyces abyssalis]OEV27306.1 phosphate ABC transporter permease [Streptomyces nanshensis]
MSNTVLEKPQVTDPPPSSPALARRRLPRWSPIAVALVSAGLGIGIGNAAGWQSRIQWGLIGALLFVAITYGVTALVEDRRQARDKVATSVIWVCFAVAVVPLVSLAWTTISRGAKLLDGYFLSHSMGGMTNLEEGGGVYHALLGTLEQVGIATLIAAPVGLLTAVYLVEYGRGRLARAVTFFVDVMTGIPSIVAGLFVLAFWNLGLGFGPSGFAGAMALAILMMPVVVRSTEEMLKLVPNELREASLALGVPKWLTILKVVIPTSIGGITTGVMLAVARITGETAPVMLLVFGNTLINPNPFSGAQESLPLYVWNQYKLGNAASIDRAWAGALTLIAFVMLLNLLARGIARWKAPKAGGR